MGPKRMRTVEGSCWPCKDRRVLCDLQRPRCSRCTASGQPCGYGQVRLRWCNGIAARGRFAGQNTPIFASEGSSGQENTSASVSPPRRFSLLSPAGSGPDPVMTADHLMLYFQHEVVDRFNLSPDRLQVDLVSVCKDPALLQSVTAVANAHHFLYARNSPEDAILAKKMARLSAIKMFRKQLAAPRLRQLPVQTSAGSGQNDAVSVTDLFVTNVLLCILDGIIEPDDEGAATYWHFRGGRAILAQWRFLDRLFEVKKGLPALMLSIFATMDLTYALLSGQDTYFPYSTWMNFAECAGWWGTLPPGDPFLEIMAILSHLARLGHQARETRVAPPLGELLSMRKALERNGGGPPEQQTEEPPQPAFLSPSPSLSLPPSPPLSAPDADGSETLDYDRSWAIFCSAYRHTALIYIYRALCNLEVTHPLVQQATGAGVQAICETRLAGKLSHCLLFPTLVVGSQCREEEQRRALRKTLLSTATFLYFGSIPVMDSFLQDVWAASDPDVDWWDCFDEISRKTFLF